MSVAVGMLPRFRFILRDSQVAKGSWNAALFAVIITIHASSCFLVLSFGYSYDNIVKTGNYTRSQHSLECMKDLQIRRLTDPFRNLINCYT